MVIIGVEDDQEVAVWELALVMEEEKEFMVWKTWIWIDKRIFSFLFYVDLTV